MRVRILKARRFKPTEIHIDWDLLDFTALLPFKEGDLVRDRATGYLSEVVRIINIDRVKLRRLDDHGFYEQNPPSCEPVSGLEALGEQAGE
jgi:hypothetical protein